MVARCSLVLLLCLYQVFGQFTDFPPPVNFAEEGESFTFRCSHTNAVSIAWFRDGVSVTRGVGGTSANSTLTIDMVDRVLNNASYSCVVTTPTNTTERKDFDLQVLYIDQVTVALVLDECSGDTVYVGSTVTLTCTPDGFPTPTVTWLHRGMEVTSGVELADAGRTLTIRSIVTENAGDWVCRAVNSLNRLTDSEPTVISVQVEFDRRATIMHESGSQILVAEGGMASLRCVFNPPLFGEDKSGVFWTVDGSGVNPASSDYTALILRCDFLLTITNIRAMISDGTYRCHHDDQSIVSEPVELVIAHIRQTYSLALSPGSPIGVGQEVTITCTPVGPAGDIQELLSWEFNSSSTHETRGVADGGRVSIDRNNQRLIITDLQEDDSGVWSCVAAHPLDITQRVVTSMTLEVEAPPQVVVTPPTSVVRVGTPLTITCDVASQRDVTFMWVVGGVSYTQSTDRINITTSTSSTQSTLTLVTVEETDLGNVSCVAQDPIHLPVFAHSTLTEDPAFYLYGNSDTRQYRLLSGGVFRLDCGVRGGGADPTVQWFMSNLEIVNNSRGFLIRNFPNGTSSLSRNQALLTDEGSEYWCKAVRPGDAEALIQRFNIFITIPGRFIQNLSANIDAFEGQDFQIDCLVSGRPRPTVTWQFEDKPVNSLGMPSVQDLGNGSIVFRPVQRSHAGVYVCVIESPFLFQPTTLDVREPSGLIPLTYVDMVLIVVIMVIAFIVLLCSVGFIVFICVVKYCLSSKTSGSYDIKEESMKAFERQPSLRDRKDNSGILRSSPSNDIFEALRKSPEDTFRYTDSHMYNNNPTTIQLDMYGGGVSSAAPSEKIPPTSYNSTPLHGTMASTSLFSSDEPTIPNYPRSNLELGDVMGEGEFGPVVLGVANHILPKHDKTLVAVKVLVMRDDDEVHPDLILMDFANQMKLTYTNIASIIGICSDHDPYYIIYEYLDQGDLKKFLQRSEPEAGDPPSLTPADIRKIILQVADGMAYLFSQRIIHGDLATRNCLVSSTLEIKIADLGIGHDLYNDDYYDNGSQLLPIRWMPPELLQQLIDSPTFSLHSDIWSFGVLCWEIFAYAKLPYESFDDSEVLVLVPDGSRLRKPGPACPDTLYSLMLECWSELPDMRPQFARLCVDILDLDFSGPPLSQ